MLLLIEEHIIPKVILQEPSMTITTKYLPAFLIVMMLLPNSQANIGGVVSGLQVSDGL